MFARYLEVGMGNGDGTSTDIAAALEERRIALGYWRKEQIAAERRLSEAGQQKSEAEQLAADADQLADEAERQRKAAEELLELAMSGVAHLERELRKLEEGTPLK